MKRIRVIITAVLVGFWAAHTAEAMWADVPLDKLVADNPVVLVGKIEDIRVSQPLKDKFDTAYIKVAEVLKNGLENRSINKGDRIPLSMPSAKGLAVSTDIRYPKGTEGIWILKYTNKTFWATYPKEFQPMKQRDQIAQIIRETANGTVQKEETDEKTLVGQFGASRPFNQKHETTGLLSTDGSHAGVYYVNRAGKGAEMLAAIIKQRGGNAKVEVKGTVIEEALPKGTIPSTRKVLTVTCFKILKQDLILRPRE